VAGTLVFNELVVIPYFGFNLNTKEAIAIRKELQEKQQDETNTTK